MSERTLIELLYGTGAHANSLACVDDVSSELAGRRALGAWPPKGGGDTW
jgi:hypothetical protein